MEQIWEVGEVSELAPVAAAVLAVLQERQDGGSASVLALSGDLGAGKTTFMQELARQLGVTETVTSPTFVVMKGYELTDQAWDEIIHIDAYRIEDESELGPLRFAELLGTPRTLLCIEWAEKIADALPPHTLQLSFASNGVVRTIHFHD